MKIWRTDELYPDYSGLFSCGNSIKVDTSWDLKRRCYLKDWQSVVARTDRLWAGCSMVERPVSVHWGANCDRAFYASGVGACEALSGKIRQYDLLKSEAHISIRYSSLS